MAEGVSEILLRAEDIDKRFGATHALHKVKFSLRSQQIHGLVGENGSGKSTLVKILAGLCPSDEGKIFFRGQRMSPQDQRRSVFLLSQDPALAGELSVEENILLGVEKSMWRKTSPELLKALFQKLNLPREILKSQASSLSVAQAQLVDLARALYRKPEILLLDEPTSRLSAAETEQLFGLLKELREQGHTLVLISHFLEDVFSLCDEVTVLREGEVVFTDSIKNTSARALSKVMSGAEKVSSSPSVKSLPGKTVLELNRISRPPQVTSVSLSLKEREIHGLYGLVGSGRSECLEALWGLEGSEEDKASGEVKIFDENFSLSSLAPRNWLQKKVVFIGEDTREDFLFLSRSLKENVCFFSAFDSAPWKKINRLEEDSLTQDQIKNFQIRAYSSDQSVETLSGGNQQKVALARSLSFQPRILILDEPTRGLDLRTKKEIQNWLPQWAAQGISILWVSSSLEELKSVCHRISVFFRGRCVGTYSADESRDHLLHVASTGREL